MDKKVKEKYQKDAFVYDERFSTIKGKIIDKKQKKALVDFISGTSKKISILEVGCGSGRFLNFLEKKGYKNLYGVDQAKNMLKVAKKRTKAKLKVGDIYKLPYGDNEFDVVFSVHVMMHVDYPKKMLKEMLRVSKNLIIVDINNKLNPFSIITIVYRFIVSTIKGKLNLRPHMFSVSDIRKIVENKKIRIIPTYMFPLKTPFNNKIYFNLILKIEKILYSVGLKGLATQLFLCIKK